MGIGNVLLWCVEYGPLLFSYLQSTIPYIWMCAPLMLAEWNSKGISNLV